MHTKSISPNFWGISNDASSSLQDIYIKYASKYVFLLRIFIDENLAVFN